MNIAVIPPGKESFVYHSHQFEEEWIYRTLGERGRRDRREGVSGGAGGLHGVPDPGCGAQHV